MSQLKIAQMDVLKNKRTLGLVRNGRNFEKEVDNFEKKSKFSFRTFFANLPRIKILSNKRPDTYADC